MSSNFHDDIPKITAVISLRIGKVLDESVPKNNNNKEKYGDDSA